MAPYILSPFEAETLRWAISSRNAAWWAVIAAFAGAAANTGVVFAAFWVQKLQFDRETRSKRQESLAILNNATTEIRMFHRTLHKTFNDLTIGQHLKHETIMMCSRRLLAAERTISHFERETVNDPIMVYLLVSARERAEYARDLVGQMLTNPEARPRLITELSDMRLASIHTLNSVQRLREKYGLAPLPPANVADFPNENSQDRSVP